MPHSDIVIIGGGAIGLSSAYYLNQKGFDVTILDRNDETLYDSCSWGSSGMIVPSQGGIGSYHLAVKLGLTGIGIAVQPALLFAFAVHTAQTFMTIIFGIISSILLISIKKSENV